MNQQTPNPAGGAAAADDLDGTLWAGPPPAPAADPLTSNDPARPRGAQRCSATAKPTSVRCAQPVVKGATVCRFHGGRAPQVAKAAARRVATAEAEALLAQLVPADAPPIADVAFELARLASELVASRTAAATMVAARSQLSDPLTGMADPALALWLRLIDQSGKLLADMARLGIDARRQELDQDAAAAIARIVGFAMAWVVEQVGAGATAAEIGERWPSVVAGDIRRIDAAVVVR